MLLSCKHSQGSGTVSHHRQRCLLQSACLPVGKELHASACVMRRACCAAACTSAATVCCGGGEGRHRGTSASATWYGIFRLSSSNDGGRRFIRTARMGRRYITPLKQPLKTTIPAAGPNQCAWVHKWPMSCTGTYGTRPGRCWAPCQAALVQSGHPYTQAGGCPLDLLACSKNAPGRRAQATWHGRSHLAKTLAQSHITPEWKHIRLVCKGIIAC